MDWKKELRNAVKEKKAVLGIDKTVKLLKKGQGKLLILASNCPKTEEIKYYSELTNIQTIEFEGDSIELGALAKKPFRVSVILIE
ncbi:MAG: 50S ribosomal protein L30e [Candidatus Altiarchaeota archaeon]|nr:50S ribosomal protein L30e [Candidatus Altiarchaeota archaeon]